jgi:hypothetical protein
MDEETKRVERLTGILSGELFMALGLKKDGLIARCFSPLARRPIQNFAKICVGFDQRVANKGFQAAAKWIMPYFASTVEETGAYLIPHTGPLLIASNHPGAYDSLAIASKIPRDDLKIIVNIPLDFISEIPTTLTHFLYAPLDAYVRMGVLRAAINHLKSGGALLLFAGGGIDPDPTTMKGAENELKRWSRSLEIMLRKVPETTLNVTIVSNILQPEYINHPFTRFRKERQDKQRIAEFFQVMNQMQSTKARKSSPHITFSKPYHLNDILKESSEENLMASVHAIANRYMKIHLKHEM